MNRARTAVLLALPLLAVPVLVARVADEQAERIGAGLARASQVLALGQNSQAERDREVVTDWRAQLAELWDELASAPASRIEVPNPRGRTRSAAPGGIRVGANTVLAIAERGAQPSGIFVPAETKRPAGLMLLGVSGLGIGLRDGDILTHAAGQPATSEGQVVSLVLSARGARLPQIGGRVWRSGASFPLVVEQPYLPSHGRQEPNEERAKREAMARPDGTG